MFERLTRRFGSPLRLALVAALLSAPALGLGFQADDHYFQVAHQWEPAWRWFTWPKARVDELRARGGLVWWTSPHLEVAFARPLASLSHALEMRLYPDVPALMLLINMAIYAACVFTAATAYRRLAPDLASGALAGAMFALNPGHAESVGWIAARNTLLSTLFSLAALLLHVDAFRKARSGGLRAGSVLCVALALGTAESGVWALSLLLAHACTLETDAWRARLGRLAPTLLLAAGWAAMYAGTHAGLHGSSWYRELAEPQHVLAQGLLDLPLWTAALLGPSFVSPFNSMPAIQARAVALPVAALMLFGVSAALRRDRACRFFACAAAFCTLPLFLTVPQERVSLGPAFGIFGWLACFITRDASVGAWRRSLRKLFVGLHGWLALLCFPLWLGTASRPLELATRQLISQMQPIRQVVLINAPIELLPGYVFVSLAADPAAAWRAPGSLQLLYSGGAAIEVERPSANALELQVARGWGYAPMERMFCAERDLTQLSERLTARDLSVRILERTREGRPARVRFTFPDTLESPERKWLIWQGQRAVAWTPPRVGAQIELPAQSIFSALPR